MAKFQRYLVTVAIAVVITYPLLALMGAHYDFAAFLGNCFGALIVFILP
jgi:hypothetical protein